MVYDWSNKEQLCYEMYIDNKRPLEEIMHYFKTNHNFAPSKRAFQTQFKRWDFPSKQRPAYRNEALVARVKELWERNTTQREMLQILTDEGFDIKERELMRLRTANRWLMRVPNGTANGAATSSSNASKLPASSDEDDLSVDTPLPDNDAVLDEELQQVLFHQDSITPGPPSPAPRSGDRKEITLAPRSTTPPPSPGLLAKRKAKLELMQTESNARWAARKRRRRTRGWAGLPADPPGPPRFPCEMTIEEAKGELNLTVDLYRTLRDRFAEICENSNITKKTLVGPNGWQSAKNQLIQDTPHLHAIFWASSFEEEKKILALDLICIDVTKRLRTLERRMTLAEAKNSLGLNPEQSRDLRNSFYKILKDDHFTSKLETGEEHWNYLKDKWIQGSDLLSKVLITDTTDPNHAKQVKALEVLSRDVMKRLRDDQLKKYPERKTDPFNFGQGTPRPADSTQTQIPMPAQTMIQAPPPLESQSIQLHPDHSNLQIDPSLLLAANDPTLALDQHHQQYDPQNYVPQHSFPQAPSLGVYFRLSINSAIQQNPKLWLGTLSEFSLNELRQLAVTKHPNAIVTRIVGAVKEASGEDVSFDIEQDDELDAYLSHVEGGKATFLVQLIHGNMHDTLNYRG
ncbi:MAG: hypothetical protein M1829_003410 [Trizodia sp. TS-e1964]|nr:MAG: hypothetical protein M1829_003410 [Trizodia sp. TS-e1964]